MNLSSQINWRAVAARSSRRPWLVWATASLLLAGSAGAQLVCDGAAESFGQGIPPGWSVVDSTGGSGFSWTGLAGCGESSNTTGGTGDAACASSDQLGPGPFDTELRSPTGPTRPVAACRS